jgi:hypothetical protein
MQRTAFRTLATIALAAAAAIPSTMSTSEARTALPASGRTFSMADMPCFVMGYSGMTNTCSSYKYLEIPLTHDYSFSNWLSPRVTAQGTAPSGTVGCTAVAIKNDWTAVWSNNNSTQYEFTSVFGVAQDIVLDIFAPGDSGLYITCVVYPGGRVNLVRW